MISLLSLAIGAHPGLAVEPDMNDYVCLPVFQANVVPPNIAYLIDSGVEMEHIVWHPDFDNTFDFTPRDVAADRDVLVFQGITNILTLNPVTNPNFVPGDGVTGATSGATGTVSSFDAGTGELTVASITGVFVVGEIVAETTGAGADRGSGTVTNIEIVTANGFFNENGYGLVKASTGNYYLMPILDTLLVDANTANGLWSASNTFTINGRTVTLPFDPASTADPVTGVIDNATQFRYSKNYMNWLFFQTVGELELSGGAGTFQVGETITGGTSGATAVVESITGNALRYKTGAVAFFQVGETITGALANASIASKNNYDGDGYDGTNGTDTDFPLKSRFYYAKTAIIDTSIAVDRRAKFGIFNFVSSGPTPTLQSFQYVTDVEDATTINDLDSAVVNAVNNMGTTNYSPLAKGLARVGGFYASQASGVSEYDCQKNFIVLLSSGLSSDDQGAPPSSSPDAPFSGLDDYDSGDAANYLGITYDEDDGPGTGGEGYVGSPSWGYLVLENLTGANPQDGGLLLFFSGGDFAFAWIDGAASTTLPDGTPLGAGEVLVKYRDKSGFGDKPFFPKAATLFYYDAAINYVGVAEVDRNLPNIPTNYLGSTHADDVAYFLNKHDIVDYRDGFQNVATYTVGFMAEDLADRYLINTSNNGNGNLNLYNQFDVEYGRYHFSASDPSTVGPSLLAAINDILERAASGTAVSVLATSGEGEGNLVQAYFRPVVPSGTNEVKWLGYLQSLWVDAFGNLREDTVADAALDVEEDNIIKYFIDTGTGDTMVRRFFVSAATPYPDTSDTSTDPSEVKQLHEMQPVWEAGKRLHARSPFARKIFTFIDTDNDGVPNSTDLTNLQWDNLGQVRGFTTTNAALIKPYLGVKDDATYSWLAGSLANTHDNRVANLINFTRGSQITNLRNRWIDGNVWKLADIIHSTPVLLSKPPDNYHIIYSDQSYGAFYNAHKDRESVVVVGSNAGFLHLFTSWKFNTATNGFEQPGATTEQIGDELWAYIPQALLPHLKWLAHPSYEHIYYVDLKPKVFDAKIRDHDIDDGNFDGQLDWSTLVLVGFNMGGQHIQAEGDFDYDGGATTPDTVKDFWPTYALIDITDPRNPVVLWEKTYTGLGLTTSFPAVMKVKDKWFAVFGSGPDADAGAPNQCVALSSRSASVYVVDLATGNAYSDVATFGAGATNGWLFQASEPNAFMNSPVTIDYTLDYNVDGIYFGETWYDSTGSVAGDPDPGATTINWKGKLYKVTIPSVDANGDYDLSSANNYSDNPLDADATKAWYMEPLFDAHRPISSSVALSKDAKGNVWTYFGTGRYFSQADKTNTDKQYLLGLKDPFFNPDQPSYYHIYASNAAHPGTPLVLDHSDLFNADPFVVVVGGEVFENDSYYGTFTDLLNAARQEDGWTRTLTLSGERVLTKFAVLGGIVFTPSFVPNDDPCGFGGDSYLYGQ